MIYTFFIRFSAEYSSAGWLSRLANTIISNCFHDPGEVAEGKDDDYDEDDDDNDND